MVDDLASDLKEALAGNRHLDAPIADNARLLFGSDEIEQRPDLLRALRAFESGEPKPVDIYCLLHAAEACRAQYLTDELEDAQTPPPPKPVIRARTEPNVDAPYLLLLLAPLLFLWLVCGSVFFECVAEKQVVTGTVLSSWPETDLDMNCVADEYGDATCDPIYDDVVYGIVEVSLSENQYPVRQGQTVLLEPGCWPGEYGYQYVEPKTSAGSDVLLSCRRERSVWPLFSYSHWRCETTCPRVGQ